MNCILPNIVNIEIKYNSFCYKKAHFNALEAYKCVREFFSGSTQNQDSSVSSLKGRCREIFRVPTLIVKAILLCIPIINKLIWFSPEEIAINLVKQDGEMLEHLSEDLRDNKEIALAAVKQNGKAFQHISLALKEDAEVCKEAHNTIMQSSVDCSKFMKAHSFNRGH